LEKVAQGSDLSFWNSRLLLGGSKSPSFLTRTLDALSRVLPNVELVELQGLSHGAALDGGKPERVAQELQRFFLEPEILEHNSRRTFL